jgi:hypothetical protein
MKVTNILLGIVGVCVGILLGVQFKFFRVETCLRKNIWITKQTLIRNKMLRHRDIRNANSTLISQWVIKEEKAKATVNDTHIKEINSTNLAKSTKKSSVSRKEIGGDNFKRRKKKYADSVFAPCPKNKNKIPRPAFVMPGVEKGGTTALYNFLLKHPQILSKLHMQEAGGGSETLFLGEHWNRRGANEPLAQKKQRYSNMFHSVANGKNGLGCSPDDPIVLAGDKTPSYIALPKGVEKLFTVAPEARIIISLREPVSRALSSYRYFGHFKAPFGVHIQDELSLINEFNVSAGDKSVEKFNKFNDALLTRYKNKGRRYHRGAIVGFGLYSIMLNHWMHIFPRNRFLILFLEEWRGDTVKTARTLNTIFEFLGLPNRTSEQLGNTKRLINKTPKQNEKTKPVSPNDIKKLQQFYKPYNQALENLLGRKLPKEWYY